MNFLRKDQLHLVTSKFRPMVIDMWKNGENVPIGVTFLSDKVPSDKDTKRARELAQNLGWKNV